MSNCAEYFAYSSFSSSTNCAKKHFSLTSVVTSLIKGKMALTLVADVANCRHSAKKACLEGWALRCNLLQMKTRSLQQATNNEYKNSSSVFLYIQFRKTLLSF